MYDVLRTYEEDMFKKGSGENNQDDINDLNCTKVIGNFVKRKEQYLEKAEIKKNDKEKINSDSDGERICEEKHDEEKLYIMKDLVNLIHRSMTIMTETLSWENRN